MIIGIGIDMVDVERIRRAVDDAKTGRPFRMRVFTEAEIAYCERRRHGYAESFAARFAAKEAVMKALGRGFGDGVAWHDIEVVRERGAPTLRVTGAAAARATALGITRWHLSLTHTATVAVAYVIGEGEGGSGLGG
jgi:holo-[acyl-carrier protein] synthase